MVEGPTFPGVPDTVDEPAGNVGQATRKVTKDLDPMAPTLDEKQAEDDASPFEESPDVNPAKFWAYRDRPSSSCSRPDSRDSRGLSSASAKLRKIGRSLSQHTWRCASPEEGIARRNSWRTSHNLAVDQIRESIIGVSRLGSADFGLQEAPKVGLRAKVHQLLEHRFFQLAISAIILGNALYIGIETDAKRGKNSFDGVELIFVVIFVVEIGLRLYVDVKRFFCGPIWEAGWNYFDLGLVCIACIDLCIISVFFDQAAEDLEGFSVLRTLRVLRIARVLRLLQFFSELWLLVSGVLDAMRSLVWAWILIFIIVYVFGVLMTGVFGKPHGEVVCEEDKTIDSLFGSVYKSMFTLFSVITINGWGDIARCVMQAQSWSWVVFVLFLLCTSFGMLNVVIAVIVEGTLERALKQQREKAQLDDIKRRDIIAQIYDLFRISDENKNGLVSREEFLTSLENPSVKRKFLAIGIDHARARDLFDILDYDSSGSLCLQEYVQGMLRARGEAHAKDIIALQSDLARAEYRYCEELQATRDRFFQRMENVDREIDAVHVEIKRMINSLEASGCRSDASAEDTCLLSYDSPESLSDRQAEREGR